MLRTTGGYLHLTRTFFPRRSLQTTSIILAGAAQGEGGRPHSQDFRGLPGLRSPGLQVSRSQAPSLPRETSVHRSDPSGPESSRAQVLRPTPRDTRQPRLGPFPSPEGLAPGFTSYQLSDPELPGPGHFPGLRASPRDLLTSNRLEPPDATTSSSLELRAQVNLRRETEAEVRDRKLTPPTGWAPINTESGTSEFREGRDMACGWLAA